MTTGELARYCLKWAILLALCVFVASILSGYLFWVEDPITRKYLPTYLGGTL